MVIINPPWEYPYDHFPIPQPIPYIEPAYPMEWKKPKIEERHVKEVKKGIMIKFEDGTWLFVATDDECYKKIRSALDGN